MRSVDTWPTGGPDGPAAGPRAADWGTLGRFVCVDLQYTNRLLGRVLVVNKTLVVVVVADAQPSVLTQQQCVYIH